MREEAFRTPAVDATAVLRTSRLYRHLGGLGISDHVRCWFIRKVDGSAGTVVVDDRAAFLATLLATGRFCQDSLRGGMLHAGHVSFREMATESGEALHVTAASGDYIWMHLDKVSPSPSATLDGRCRYGTRQAAAHLRRDVLPLLRSQATPRAGAPTTGHSPAPGKRPWLAEMTI